MLFLLVNLFLLGQLPLTSLIVSLCYVIDCFTGFSLSQAAISLVFTPFVFLNNARKEHVLYLNQAERAPFFFHSPDRRSARHFCFSVDFSDQQISASRRSKPGCRLCRVPPLPPIPASAADSLRDATRH